MERVIAHDGLAERLGKHVDLRAVLLWTKRLEIREAKTGPSGHELIDKLGRYDAHTLDESLEQLGSH